MKILEMIGKAFVVLSACVWIWIGASWVDIVADNSMPNPVHSEYNFFTVCFGGDTND